VLTGKSLIDNDWGACETGTISIPLSQFLRAENEIRTSVRMP